MYALLQILIQTYRLLGKRALGAKRLVVSSKVLFPAIPTQNCDVVLTFPSTTEDETLMWLLARIKTRAPNLRVQVRHHSHTGIYGFYLTALYESLLQGAEELGILKPLKAEYGGGMKEFAFEDQDCFAGIEEEASFLTSQERQSIVLHFLNELRATGDDSLKGITFIEGQPIVPLLITKNVISQLFPLHNHADLKVLRKKWVQALFSRQPLELVCQYFGVKISLYFAYLGHYTTWLLLPALLGLIIFSYQGDNQYIDDLCFVGFALFNSLWSTLYLKFWSRTSTSRCYKWGTLQKKDELLKDPRPLFKGDPVKSPVTGHPELFFPPWKRFLFLHFVTVPIVVLCLAFVFVAMLLCFELQEWVNSLIEDEELPYVFSFLPKVLLAVVVSILDEIYKKLAVWLTYKENYRLEESHETGLILKLVLFQFVNSFLSLFYIGFYLKDMDRLRDQLAALLITRQVLGNLKEALMPYVIWKARLYSVGYKLATRMSPASLDKAMERMTQQANSKAGIGTGEADKLSKSDEEDDEQDESIPILTQAEVESEMKKYDGTLEDYLEMVIQFGYVTLFSSAFPLAALCALVNNVIEIRSDAFKLCITHQRPFGQQVESIGIWQDVLMVMSVLAVTVNCALISTSGLVARFFPDLTTGVYCIIFIAVEHLLITGKFILYRSIPDFPNTVATEMAKLEYKRTEALKQLLVTHTVTSSLVGGVNAHRAESLAQRRRLCGEEEASMGEDMSQRSTSNIGHTIPASSVITPASTIQRPCDFHTPPQTPLRCRGSELDKPAVPLRKSLLKNKPSSSENNIPASFAESMVEAAMDPLSDTQQGEKTPNLKFMSGEKAQTYGDSLPPPGRPGERSRGQPSDILKRVYRKRLDQESWRRRSEPVASAVQQAVDLQKNSQGECAATQEGSDGFRHTRSFSLREEIKRSKEKMHMLEKSRHADSAGLSPKLPHVPSLSSLSLSSSLPPPAASTGLKYCASPRLKQKTSDAALPRPFRPLSRKSRSLSSTDISDIKQSVRDRISWKGELSVTRKSSDDIQADLEKKHEDFVKDVSDEPDEKDLNKLRSTSNNQEPSITSSIHPRTSEGPSVDSADSQENHHVPGVMRASRESQAKPLNLSQGSLHKK
ncbi:anoctamin [Plakobranchus ocellatus]|uniref:Anoctamin n=1 Tax=Plakobranchus ocellatus TaxID=259542 RepID=A0AAV4DQF8_9GAST|nr:anoctamin [Plakobranchus ocellatus]